MNTRPSIIAQVFLSVPAACHDTFHRHAGSVSKHAAESVGFMLACPSDDIQQLVISKRNLADYTSDMSDPVHTSFAQVTGLPHQGVEDLLIHPKVFWLLFCLYPRFS